ncbi:hypothetical protein BC835DRAFT_718085 [Cytidiella melzeri]|nr:hypothetical protein BC835DRAFT_718085 [Cytidiella melzeri]
MTVPVNSDMDINWGEPEFSAKGDVVSIIRQARPEAFSFLTFIDITLIDVSDSSIIASKTTAVHKSTVIAPQHVDNKCILLHIMNGGEYCTEVWAVVPITNGQELCHIATFGFPTVHPSLVAPLNGSIAGSSGGGLMTGNVPAVPCVRSTTNPLVFLLRYYNGLRNPTAPPTRVIHIFPLSVITSVVDAYTNTQTPREMPRFRPWKEWGPRNSRCFVDNTTVITGSYGSQMVLSNYSLLDFNPRDIARDLHYLEKSSPSASSMSRSSAVGRRIRSLGRRGSDDGDVEMPDGGVIVRRPTVYRKGKLFMEDVITSLPYRESKLNWTGPRPVLIFGGEVWVICTFENESDGTISHKCYTLSQ